MELWTLWTHLLEASVGSLASYFGFSEAVAIIVLTLMARLALMPVSLTAAYKMQLNKEAMNRIKPALEELRETYRDKPSELAARTMALYRENGISFLDKVSMLKSRPVPAYDLHGPRISTSCLLGHAMTKNISIATTALIALVCATSLSASAEMLIVTTDRGAKVEVLADFPAGPGPFPAIVLALGQGYHMTLPALEQTAKRLVSQGVAVYRFNWAYFTAAPKTGSPSEDLTSELQDMNAVLAAAQAEPRVSRSKLSVGGKSLGTVVAWRALVGNKLLQAGLFLTAVCSRVPKGRSVPDFLADENYPGVAAQVRPLLFISGDQDPLCAPPVLYRFAANSGGKARVAIVGGDHSFENNALTVDAANEARTRNIDLVAELAANFVSEVARR